MATVSPNIVKIGIKLCSDDEQLQELKEFDLNHTVASVIEEICQAWGLSNPSEYMLKFPEDIQRNYVTESNKNEIKSGLLLILDKCPQIKAKEILSNLELSTDLKIAALKKLTHLSKYMTFAKEFIELKGLSQVMFIIGAKRFTPPLVAFALTSFAKLMDHCIVSWNIVDTDLIDQIVSYVSNKSFYDFPMIVSVSLSILKNCILYNNEKSSCIQKDVLVTDLIMRVGTSIGNDQLLKRKVITLINVLFIYADMNDRKIIGATLLSKEVRNIIRLNMYKPKNLSPELENELHILQSNCLSLIEQRVAKIDRQSQYSKVLVRELSRIVSEGEENARLSVTSEISTNKMGFTDDDDPVSDLNDENSPGALALDCMVYFARNYMDSYVNFILENNCINETHQCPFGKSSIELVGLLSDILKAKQSPSDRKFYPVFFNHAHPFEELFCICIVLLNKTWKEMKATSEDSASVFNVVREQIIQTLSTFPINLGQFRKVMKAMTYAEITNIWQKERAVREKRESHARPIVELKEQLKPEILSLLKHHRLQILMNGTRFCKVSAKGMVIKRKFWFIRLSPNHTFFQYGDMITTKYENNKPALGGLENIIPISKIKSLRYGKNSSNVHDKKNNKFSITVESDDKTAILDFITPNMRVFDYWIDGISALLNDEMSSKTYKEDLATLMSMEIRLRLLDTEGVNIPVDPPPIPKLPADFDYLPFKSITTNHVNIC